MKVFNDTELFSSGLGGKNIFDLPDSELILIDNFFNKEESDYYYNSLLNQIQWHEYDMPIYNKIVTAPRMVSWYSDTNLDGRESNKRWQDELQIIRQRVENETLIKFNVVLLYLYRNGKDGVGWHSDKTSSINKNMNIASVTFGETRIFRLRHKFRKEIRQVEIPLHHGSFLLMARTTNSFWQHQVPKTSRTVLQRINLTFRQVMRN